MLSERQQIIEDRPAQENRPSEDLTVRVISYDSAKQLGDAICAKYRKAFDLLKDK